MAVFRVEKTKDFTIMCNHHLRNTKLSLKAKGLMSLMLSLPEDWDYTTKGLAHICKDGIDSISTALKELEQQGYLTRQRLRNANGQLGDIEYTIHEQPVTPETEPFSPKRENPRQVNPRQDFPEQAKPEQENPAQLNTNRSKTEKSKTNLSRTYQSIYPKAGERTYRQEPQDRIDRMDMTDAYRELIIQMILEKNNMHDFDTFQIFKWIFKTFVATYLLTNCFTIVMAVFDLAQNVVSRSAGIINGSLNVNAALTDLQTQLEAMGVWELIGLWLETNIIHLCMWILSIVIFVIVYGRMIEIYLTVSLAPIPFSTMANHEWGQMGQNYLRSLFALGFQGFLILVCIAIYAVLVQAIPSSGSIHGAIWGTAGYTVLLAFALFKTGSLSKSIFNAH